jgi:rhamnosyltransferase
VLRADFKKIASVVVLYNPDDIVINNISSYLGQVSEIFVFDNSDLPNSQIIDKIKSIPKIVYYTEKKNCGIGYALNYAARWAVDNGYEYILTMDQDSVASNDMVYKLYKEFQKFDSVAISSPWIIQKNNFIKSKITKSYAVNRCITSGSLIRLQNYFKVGGYDEKLFIDYIDFDFCFKILQNNLKIVKNPQANLFHSVGNLKNWKFGPINFFSTNHAPLRLYYRTRNRFYIRKIYKDQKKFFRMDLINFAKEIIKIIFVESEKIQKLKMIYLGYYDFKKSKLGKFEGSN